MTQREHYDVIIIGAGQAGGPLSTAFATAGRKTALIERAHVGGTCVNVGCTPTKTMIASARTAYVARRAADYGVPSAAVQAANDYYLRHKELIDARIAANNTDATVSLV
jgi:pyruvate/2-oxoglutarate dehydrogenase complex dihydrolipoamide dehydrogenase (E3) component